jgi:hypothetical protein
MAAQVAWFYKQSNEIKPVIKVKEDKETPEAKSSAQWADGLKDGAYRELCDNPYEHPAFIDAVAATFGR